jgi:hypothetical protein
LTWLGRIREPRTRQAAGVHHIRAQAVRPKLDIKRFSFSQRVLSIWNLLPESLKGVGVVMAMMSGSAEGGWELNDREDRSQHSTQLK